MRATEVPGLSRGRLRAALAAGALISLRRGIVVAAEDWRGASPRVRHRLALEAALLAYPGSWASHTSATQVHGIEILAPRLPGNLPVVHVSRPGTTAREPGLVVHGQEPPASQVTMVDGLPCSDLVRATIEVAARRSLPHAAAVIDAGMRRALAAEHADVRRAALDPGLREALVATWDEGLAPYTRHRWVTTVRRAVHWADPAAESFLESISRAAMLLDGVPRPRCGVPMRGDDGVIYWLDFWWEDEQVIGEADGMGKYTDHRSLLAEKVRQEALSVAARGMVRWGMAQVVPDPGPMLARIRAALSPARGSRWS